MTLGNLFCLDFLNVLERMMVSVSHSYQVELRMCISLCSFFTGISDGPVTKKVRKLFLGTGEERGSPSNLPSWGQQCLGEGGGLQHSLVALWTQRSKASSSSSPLLSGLNPWRDFALLLPYPFLLYPGSCLLKVCWGVMSSWPFSTCPRKCSKPGLWGQESCATMSPWLIVTHALALL